MKNLSKILFVAIGMIAFNSVGYGKDSPPTSVKKDVSYTVEKPSFVTSSIDLVYHNNIVAGVTDVREDLATVIIAAVPAKPVSVVIDRRYLVWNRLNESQVILSPHNLYTRSKIKTDSHYKNMLPDKVPWLHLE